MNKEQRASRIIARGEHSNHCHVITGDVEITENNGKKYIKVTEDSNACLKHLLESEWLNGREVWTKEHTDIPLAPGTYEYVGQVEYDPYNDVIQSVKD